MSNWRNYPKQINQKEVLNKEINSMQIIALINQKGRGGKTTNKRLTNTINYFFKKRIVSKLNVEDKYRCYKKDFRIF